MITRIEVDGFKSLRDFALDLEPFTVLVGPNGAGKSNVLEALGLVSRLAAEPVTEALKHGRGRILDQFSRHGGESAAAIRIAVELFVPWFPLPVPLESPIASRFRYEIRLERQSLESGVERLVIGDERLQSMPRDKDPWIAAHPLFAPLANFPGGGHEMLGAGAEAPGSWIDDPANSPHAAPASPSHARLCTSRNFYAFQLRKDLSEFRLLQLDASRLRAPSERMDADSLAVDASNLPTMLAGLSAPRLGEIRADLVAMVPGVRSFEVVPDGDSFRIDFELAGGDVLPARLVSDGTLRILALLTAVRVKPLPSLIAIEEPENGIYPGKLRALLTLLREVSEHRRDYAEELGMTSEQAIATVSGVQMLPTQILLTSHSPVVLAALGARPEHLRFVDTVRRSGERITRVRGVGQATDVAGARALISPREIDALLHAADAEGAE